MKNYLIIGASSGIGKNLAENLARNGHIVHGTYFNNPIVSNEVNYQYFDVNAPIFNLRNFPEVLDGIVYCPGSINLLPFSKFKADDFIEDYRLQVVGAIKVIQALIPNLRKSDNGSIVLFSTVAVQSGFKFHSQVAASKGAIEGLVKSLSAELAPMIRINAVAPSLTQTPLAKKLLSSTDKITANAERHPLKRIGSTDDIAQMAEYLLSEKSSWITGQIFKVDGGMSSIRY